MLGTVAQAIALTTYGNEALRPGCAIDAAATPRLHAELSDHVLKNDSGNISDATKSPDCLKYLQLHEQPDLRRRCARYCGSPMAVLETRTD